MKRMLTVLSLCMTFAMGQTITPIADIQFVADPETSDASPLDGTEVTISGVVTGEPWGTYDARTMFVQDSDTAWSGIMVYTNGLTDVMTFDVSLERATIIEGDSVTLTGTVDEYFNLTEIVNVTAVVVHGKATNPPEPMMVTTLAADAEKYEGVLLKFVDVTVSNPDVGYGEWTITDGSGDLQIGESGDLWSYYYWPTTDAGLASIEGVMTYSFGNYLLAPRLARDIAQAGEYIRVQRLQQVLGSSLEMLPDSSKPGADTYNLDFTLFMDDTVKSIGIVMIPDNEMSQWDTTDGVLSGYSRFIWQDPHGGPWSAILSYFNDATAFPELFAGDSVVMEGYMFEYHGGGVGPNITEMFITEPVEILKAGAAVPAPSLITTGEMRHPSTAEQWEHVMVRIEDATVINNSLDFNEFSIDDGSGSVNIGAGATNTMSGSDVYGNDIPAGPFVRPPNGTTVKSLEGYAYHAYGFYSDSTTYKVYPVVHDDVELGGGPPSITDFAVTESPFGLSDAVTVSVDIADGSAVASAVVTYRVDGGTWTDAALTGTAGNWSGSIPATGTEGALVEYFLKATDDGGDNQSGAESTFFPSDTSSKLYGYYTKAAGTTIADVQFSGFSSGDSYYDGAVVTLTGTVVTLDGSAGGDFVINSEATAGFGIIVNDTSGYVPTHGDNVTMTGRVHELWENGWSKYAGNTVLGNANVTTVNSQGNTVTALTVTGAQLVANPELYEGNLITVGASTVTVLNQYDRSVSDDGGTSEYLIDDDWTVWMSPADAAHDSLKVDDVLSSITGIWNYSYASFKVQLRSLEDLGTNLGVADGNTVPLRFELSQNYPNPFNPTTTINYSLAKNAKHTLKIYNLRGALVETLVNDVRPAGRYSLVWNARNYASGMYFLRLDAEDFHSTKKLILLK